MKKKLLCSVLLCAMLMSSFAGCGQMEDGDVNDTTEPTNSAVESTTETPTEITTAVPEEIKASSAMEEFRDKGTVLFHAGFNEAKLVPEDATRIEGFDSRYPEVGDWRNTFKQDPALGNFTIEYEGGTINDRHAKLVDDPAGSANKVLEFALVNAVKNDKGRVQTSLYGNKDFTEVYYKVKLYVDPDMQVLESYTNRIYWLTLAEFWNEPFWDNDGYPFRVTLNLAKDQGLKRKLHFRLSAQKLIDGKMPDIWDEYNREFSIPYGEWMTLEFYYKEGNSENGRFIFEVTTEDGEHHTIFDINDVTMHPDNPNPKGLTHFNPMKIYTSKELIDFVNNEEGALRIYWDDFEIRDLSES